MGLARGGRARCARWSVALSGCASVSSMKIAVASAYIPQPTTPGTTVAYLDIRNNATQPDQLVSVEHERRRDGRLPRPGRPEQQRDHDHEAGAGHLRPPQQPAADEPQQLPAAHHRGGPDAGRQGHHPDTEVRPRWPGPTWWPSSPTPHPAAAATSSTDTPSTGDPPSTGAHELRGARCRSWPRTRRRTCSSVARAGNPTGHPLHWLAALLAIATLAALPLARTTGKAPAVQARGHRAPRLTRGSSATPWATAHGAHSATSTSPREPTARLCVITASLSHISTSSGCDRAQEHSQARREPTRVVRQLSRTARMAGSLESLCSASLVRAAVLFGPLGRDGGDRFRQAAASRCRGLVSLLLLIATSSHRRPIVTSGPASGGAGGAGGTRQQDGHQRDRQGPTLSAAGRNRAARRARARSPSPRRILAGGISFGQY